MCGRFLLDADFDSILYYYGNLIKYKMDMNFPKGDVYPSAKFPVITGDNKFVSLKWGIHKQNMKNLINARAESIYNKPLYKNMVYSRCIIIANSFYEWDITSKVKYKISGENTFITMGGIYSGDSFAIITIKANTFMKGIHDRMPLLLGKDEERDFLRDDIYAKEIINNPKEEKVFLQKLSNEQLKLF